MQTQNTNIKYWNKCQLYVYLRQINKKKQVRWWFSNPIIPGQHCRWLEPLPAAQGGEPNLDRTPFQHRAHSHTPTLTQSGIIYTHQFTSYAQPWDVGGNQSLEKTHSHRQREGRANSTQTVGGALAGNQLFFLINVITKWCWIKKMLFEDLLYWLRVFLHLYQLGLLRN